MKTKTIFLALFLILFAIIKSGCGHTSEQNKPEISPHKDTALHDNECNDENELIDTAVEPLDPEITEIECAIPIPETAPPHWRDTIADDDFATHWWIYYAEEIQGIPFDNWWAKERIFDFPDEAPPSQLVFTMDQDAYPLYTRAVTGVLTFALNHPDYQKQGIQEGEIDIVRQAGDEWHRLLIRERFSFAIGIPIDITNDCTVHITFNASRLLGDQFTAGTYRMILPITILRTEYPWWWRGMIWAEFTVEDE